MNPRDCRRISDIRVAAKQERAAQRLTVTPDGRLPGLWWVHDPRPEVAMAPHRVQQGRGYLTCTCSLVLTNCAHIRAVVERRRNLVAS